MKKLLHLIFIGVFFLGSISIKAQEVTFPYNGTTNLTVNSSSNINQGIKINFNDLDVVNNFFTQNQNTIYMYIALETNNVLSSWEYPYGSINNTATLIAVPLNADNNVGASPNNYSVTINPRDYFTAVPAGTTVYGYHVLFRNQFGVGGNNQTVDLYIDLQDAVYSTTCIGGNGNYDDADCDGILNSCDFDDDNDGIPDISESTCTLSGQTVRIGYIPNSRDLDTDNGYTFDGTYMIGSGTLKLANLANFGPAGTVKANVVFVPISANPITKADISALNLNIVFIGGIDDLSLNSYISAAELNAVKDWSDDSPRNVVVVSQFQAIQWGSTVTSGNVNPNTPTPLGAVSPIFNGPFGTVASFTQGGGFQAYFNSALSCSQQSLARDNSGRTTVYIDGVYNDILLSDIDILTSLGDVSAGNAITTNNDKLFANIWAFAINQSLCSGLDTDADLIPNQFDLDSDNDGCLDALEGDENVTTAQLVTASGSVVVGTGSSAASQNLGNTVDSNGVPTIVNSGGAADIGGDQGQGAGSTQNSASKDPQCLKFGCTSAMYLSQNTPAALYDINTASNPFTFPQIGANSGINYNSIGVNPLDGFIYGTIVNSNQIIRIYSDGTYTNLGAVTGLPVLTYNSGEIDDLGNYYVKQNTNNNTLYKINLTTLTATSQTLTASINVPDMAYNVVTDLLYGVNSTNGQLVSINPTTGAVVGIGITPGR